MPDPQTKSFKKCSQFTHAVFTKMENTQKSKGCGNKLKKHAKFSTWHPVASWPHTTTRPASFDLCAALAHKRTVHGLQSSTADGLMLCTPPTAHSLAGSYKITNNSCQLVLSALVQQCIHVPVLQSQTSCWSCPSHLVHQYM